MVVLQFNKHLNITNCHFDALYQVVKFILLMSFLGRHTLARTLFNVFKMFFYYENPPLSSWLPTGSCLSKAKADMNGDIFLMGIVSSNSPTKSYPVSFIRLVITFWGFQNLWGYKLEWKFKVRKEKGKRVNEKIQQCTHTEVKGPHLKLEGKYDIQLD